MSGKDAWTGLTSEEKLEDLHLEVAALQLLVSCLYQHLGVRFPSSAELAACAAAGELGAPQ
jgi:hypothetical protein